MVFALGHSRGELAEAAIGYCYDVGQGVAQDRVEACKWYLLATAQHCQGADINLKKLAPKVNSG